MAFFEEYTLLGELGKGGFATVYKVRHNKLGYVRAIRVMKETIARGEEDPLYQKFVEECKVLLRLGNGCNPHIIHLYQPMLKSSNAMVEMDYVSGRNLKQYLEDCRGFVETPEVLRLLREMSDALAYCHVDIYNYCMDREEDDLADDPSDGSKVLLDEEKRQCLIRKYRVVHNDIHSGNIMRRDDGSYVLLDFGLAIDGEDVVRSSLKRNGAPEYKAPEKWDAADVLPQSDIYSFGVVLYEFLAGRVPFPFDSGNANAVEAEYLLGEAHKKAVPEPVYGLRKAAFERSHPGQTYIEADYPEWLEELIFKCLAKRPEDRFQDGRALYDWVCRMSAPPVADYPASPGNVPVGAAGRPEKGSGNETADVPAERPGVRQAGGRAEADVTASPSGIEPAGGQSEAGQTGGQSGTASVAAKGSGNGTAETSAKMSGTETTEAGNSGTGPSDGRETPGMPPENGKGGRESHAPTASGHSMPEKKPVRRRGFRGWMAVAAALLLLAGGTGIFLLRNNRFDLSVIQDYDDVGKWSEDLLSVRKGGKYGFLDRRGRVAIPLEYDWTGRFHDGLAIVEKNGRWGCIDREGTVVVPLAYDRVDGFSEGLALVRQGGKYGFVDSSGREVVPLVYDDGDCFIHGFAEVSRDGETFLIDREGRRKH